MVSCCNNVQAPAYADTGIQPLLKEQDCLLFRHMITILCLEPRVGNLVFTALRHLANGCCVVAILHLKGLHNLLEPGLHLAPAPLI